MWGHLLCSEAFSSPPKSLQWLGAVEACPQPPSELAVSISRAFLPIAAFQEGCLDKIYPSCCRMLQESAIRSFTGVFDFRSLHLGAILLT